MEDAVVVVPVYKDKMNLSESCSWNQLWKILGKYSICVIAPMRLRGFSLEKHCQVVYFPDSYFTSSYAYGSLLTEAFFYEQFQSYEYMLIYQLDAFVFSDRLRYFCSLGYDYIGAPMPFSQWKDVRGMVGNGGFSLRRIASCLSVCQRKQEIIKQTDCKPIFLRIEDKFFGYCGYSPKIDFKVPSVKLALEFAIEFNVAHCWERLAPDNLPFGCHAWSKPRYFNLWRPLLELYTGDLSAVAKEIAAKGAEDYREIVWAPIRPYLWQRILKSTNDTKFRRCLSGYLPLAKEFVLWGNGQMAARGLEWMNRLHARIYCIFDQKAKPGESTAGIPVRAPDRELLLGKNRAVLITTTKFEAEVAEQLEMIGLCRGTDFFALGDLERHLLDTWYPCQKGLGNEQG